MHGFSPPQISEGFEELSAGKKLGNIEIRYNQILKNVKKWVILWYIYPIHCFCDLAFFDLRPPLLI